MKSKKKIGLALACLALVGLLIGLAVWFFLHRDKPMLQTDREEVSLFVGESALLHVLSETDDRISWTSENENIATVYFGTVKAVSVGETTVTVEADGFDKKEISVVVSPGPLEGYPDVVTYVGEPAVDITLQGIADYTFQVEKHDSGVYTRRDDLTQDGRLSTGEAGTYRITYNLEENQYVRYVRVNPLRELSNFAVLEAFDGFSPVKTAAIQFSEPEMNLRGSDAKTEYITFQGEAKEELHESLAASGYDGYLDNDSVVRVERQFTRNAYYGSYIYLDITPELNSFFDKLDEFDEVGCLSLWYRVLRDEEGTGEYQPADVTYNYLFVENAEETVFTKEFNNKAVIGSENGWMNWKIDFSTCTELVGAKRVLIAIGNWGLSGAGRIRCDFYSLEAKSLLLDAALGKKEMTYKWGSPVPYRFPSFSMTDLDQNDFQIYNRNRVQMTEGEEADYQKANFNKRQWIMNLPIDTYEFRYALKGTGLKTGADGTYKVTVPVTVQNPSLAGVLENGNLYYYTSHMYEGCIDSPNTSPVQKAKTSQLSEADYRELLEAGYAGAIEGRTYNSVQIGTEMKADNQARSIGLIFPGTSEGKLKKLLENERIRNNYYVSVWVRIRNEAEQSCTSKVWAAVYNKNAKQQRNSFLDGTVWNEEYAFKNNQWVELKIPAAAVVGAYKEFGGAFPGASEESFGISLPWLMVAGNEFKSPVHVDVFGAELCYNDIHIKIGEKADVQADPVLYYDEAELSFELYKDGRKLAKGKDYQVENQTLVSGLSDGVYTIEYTGLNGILHFKRKLSVEPKQKVLDTVLAKQKIRYYSSHDYQGSINTEHTNPIQDTGVETLSEESYQALLAAGYCGKISDRNVSRITIDMGDKKANNAARTLGILFAEVDSDNLRRYIENEKACKDYYVSIWVKANYKSQFKGAAMVIDPASRSQANNTRFENVPVTLEAGAWTEIQIPLTYVRDAYNNFHAWYGNAPAEAIPGLWVDWLMVKDGDAYPEELQFTMDIYGAQIQYSGVEVKPGQEANIAIRTDMIAPGLEYSYEVYGSDGALAQEKDYRRNGDWIAFAKAGVYGIKYQVITPKDIYQTDFTVYRTVHVLRPEQVPTLALGAAGWYFTSHDYCGTIDSPNARTAAETTQIALTGDKTANRITINMDDQKAGNAARAVGILFQDTLDDRLKSYLNNEKVQQDYELSVWVRMNVASRANATVMVADRGVRRQANTTELQNISVDFEQDCWTEVRIPLSYVAKAYENFRGWYSDTQESVCGIWFDWLMVKGGDAYPAGTVLTMDISEARILYRGITVQEAKTADVSVNTDILKPGMAYTYEIYSGDKLLQAGTDYTADGTDVVFAEAGNYTVEYTVKTAHDEYESDLNFFRRLTVTPRKQVPKMDLGAAGWYFASYDYWGAIDSPNAKPAAETTQFALTEEAYAQLLTAGYVGEADDRTANRITIDMDDRKAGNAARAVGILFPETLNGELKACAKKEEVQKDYYVSVWMRANVASDVQQTTAIVVDRKNKKQAFVGFDSWPFLELHLEENQWTELKIPMTYVAEVYNRFASWDSCAGAEEEMFGIWLDWLRVKGGDAYQESTKLELDIYGAKLMYRGITVSETEPADISVNTDILQSGMNYTYEIYRGEELLKEGTDYAVEENKVVFEDAGIYTVKYVVPTARDEYKTNLTFLRNLTVMPRRQEPAITVGKAGQYFASYDYWGAIDSSNAKPAEDTSQIMLDEEAYAALLAAGFDGESKDKTANRITIDMEDKRAGNAARAVGILFPETLNGELKVYAADPENQKDHYVSVWMRLNVASDVKQATTIVVDRKNKKQAFVGFENWPFLELHFEENQWTELRIPMTYVAEAYNRFASWGGCAGAEEEVFGIWFDWVREKGGDAYPDGTTLTIDIYGAAVRENQSLTRVAMVVQKEFFLKKKRTVVMLTK